MAKLPEQLLAIGLRVILLEAGRGGGKPKVTRFDIRLRLTKERCGKRERLYVIKKLSRILEFWLANLSCRPFANVLRLSH